MSSKVCIIKCPDYLQADINAAIKEVFSLLALDNVIKPGQKVLLKPNLLFNMSPDKGTTTHPAIVKAIADEVIKLGAQPFLGDSPGGIGAFYNKVLEDTGMKALGIPIVDFEEKGMRKFDNPVGKVDPIFISNTVLSFDIIINIPKMKTHELTQMTCGIKNLLGCVPGLHKVKYHLDAPTPEEFSFALVDLFEKIRPAVTIVDAVVSMEGQGPSNGKLRQSRLIVASKDTVAVDAVCSAIMGYDPLEIRTTKIAADRGLGEGDLKNIEILGNKIDPISGFVHPAKISSILNRMPHCLIDLIRPVINRIRLSPWINRKKCIKCMMCVKSCPVQAIDKKSFKINKNKCIMCFCCREFCKYSAVEMQESLLWKILNKLKKPMT